MCVCPESIFFYKDMEILRDRVGGLVLPFYFAFAIRHENEKAIFINKDTIVSP